MLGYVTAAIFGIDGLIVAAVFLAALVLVIAAIVQVVRSPGLSQGAKWGWALGMGIGYWFFWVPGIVLAIVFLAMKKRWQVPREPY